MRRKTRSTSTRYRLASYSSVGRLADDCAVAPVVRNPEPVRARLTNLGPGRDSVLSHQTATRTTRAA